MKGFLIEIKNDLLEPKHYEHMGIAVWLYMWLLDKVTSVSEEGIGKVLGGKPITFDEIDLGISDKTYRRWVDILEEGKYINVIRAPYGLVITINKTHKYFNKGRDRSKMTELDRSHLSSDRSQVTDVIKTRQRQDNNIPKKFLNIKFNVQKNLKRLAIDYPEVDLVDEMNKWLAMGIERGWDMGAKASAQIKKFRQWLDKKEEMMAEVPIRTYQPKRTWQAPKPLTPLKNFNPKRPKT